MISRLEAQLNARESDGKLRRLLTTKFDSSSTIDFCSNDYLGIALSKSFADRIKKLWNRYELDYLHLPMSGSTGSRLLTGNNDLFIDTEKYIASFHRQAFSLLMNSGWDLNFGVLSCVTSFDSIVIYDELCHNSILMGIQNGRHLRAVSFTHNSIVDLRSKIASVSADMDERRGEILLVVESVYSMDGDVAPLVDILALAGSVGAMVYVDEAHSIGLYGQKGEGLVCALGLENHPSMLAVAYTYGKAPGVHGAALVSNFECIIKHILNYCKPLIYSTSLPPHSVVSIRCAYEEFSQASHAREKLFQLIDYFRRRCEHFSIMNTLDSSSPIQGIIIPGNERVVAVAAVLQGKGFNCLPIRSPTVPVGSERLRIILHAFNTEEEITLLCIEIRNAVSIS